MIRFTPGIECHTHEYIRTGHLDSKFGFDPVNWMKSLNLLVSNRVYPVLEFMLILAPKFLNCNPITIWVL